MTVLVVPAPAKVNLFLHVTGQRPDGYHLIESLFALVDLADTVRLASRSDGAIVRAVELAGVAEDADLALRAARALQQASGTKLGATIGVTKRIPMGGGLGGGSSDAASVMLGLVRLWGLRASVDDLAAIGLGLGADVPFFVRGENAVVRGIGEVVRPVSLPVQWLALAIPPVSVRTGEIFAARELTRSTPSAKIDVFSEGYGCNTLEPVAASRHAEVARAIAALKSVAADARMTGSGACAIARCTSAAQAREAVAALPEGTRGEVLRTLVRHPFTMR